MQLHPINTVVLRFVVVNPWCIIDMARRFVLSYAHISEHKTVGEHRQWQRRGKNEAAHLKSAAAFGLPGG